MVDDVLRRLEEHDCRPRRSGAGWSARCPAHDDKTPSLSVSEGRDGGVVIHCHAGCTTERVCTALSLDLRDLAPPQDERPAIQATYDYHAATGELAYQVVRFAPKTFRQRRPDGAGGWIWNMQGAQRLLYHLPRVVEAVDRGDAVWITEGEKDADALTRAGLVATCNSGGAGKWQAAYSDALRGANVVIVADHDDAGRAHAAQIAANLNGKARSVNIVEAAEGKDAADHLNHGHTIGDFRALTLLDLHTTPNGDKPHQPNIDPLTLLDLAALLAAAPPPHRWVWDGYIEQGTLIVLHGDGGTGKSILAGHLARAVASGGQCLGRATTQGRVVIVDAENPLDEIHRRLHALDYQATTPGHIAYYRSRDVIFGTPTDPDTTLLRLILGHHQPQLVILDSQRGLWGGEEKDQIEIRPFYRRLQTIAEELGCAIVIIHHDRRTGSYSGSSDIHNAADTRLWLECPDPDKPERILHHAKARSSAEINPAAYTFTFDKTLNLFTFTQPREPVTEGHLVLQALDDDWLTGTEIAERAGLRRVEVIPILWELVRNREAQHMDGPPGRSKRSKCFRRMTTS